MRIDAHVLTLSAGEGARAVVLGLLADANAAAGALAAGAGDEPLHDFRVALRRLQSALRAYHPWLGRVRRRHERRVRKLARATNAARDAEVQLAWLAEVRPALAGASLRPGLALVARRYEARRREGPGAPRLARRFRRASRALEAKLGRRAAPAGANDKGRGGDGFAAVLAALVEAHAGALAERLAAIRSAADEERAHRARIADKRLRYLVEPLRGVRGADAGPVVGRLKRLQDVLGSLHDAHVLGDELRDVLVDASAERARAVHAAVSRTGAPARALRDALRASPRAGLVALVRLVRDRRDALYAELERDWLGGGIEALAREVRALAAAVEARAAVLVHAPALEARP